LRKDEDILNFEINEFFLSISLLRNEFFFSEIQTFCPKKHCCGIGTGTFCGTGTDPQFDFGA
jgi:hypothetical protein